jgi:hypothetical protein
MIKEEVVIVVKTDTTEVKRSTDDANKSTDAFADKLKKLNKEVSSGDLSFRQLNKKIKEYQSIGLQAGQSTVIGKEALQRAAALKDELTDLNTRVNNLANDGQKLQGALQMGSTVIAGYTAFQSVTALLGVENENLTKTLVKLQAAQGLLLSVEQIRAALEKDSQLRVQASIVLDKLKAGSTSLLAAATGSATGMMKAFRLALISTGIGAIVVGLGLLVANFKEVSAWVEKSIEKFRNMGTTMKVILYPITMLIMAYDGVMIALQKLGIIDSEEKKAAIKNSEDKIAQIRKEGEAKTKAIDFEIAKRKAAGKDTADLERQRREQIQESLIAEAQAILTLVKLRGEYTQEQKDRMAELKESLIKNTQESAIKEIEEAKKLEDKKAELQKKANEDAKKERERVAAEKKKQIEDEQKLADELYIANQRRTMSETDFAIQEIIRGNEEKFRIAGENAELVAQLEAEQQAQIDEVKAEQFNKELEAKKERDALILEQNNAMMEANMAQGLAELEAEKWVSQAKMEIQNASISNLENGVKLIASLDDKNKGLQAATLVASNAAGIARTIISTSASNATTIAEGAALAIPSGGASVAAAAALVTQNNIAAGISIASSVAATAKGLAALKKSGGAGGGVTPPKYPTSSGGSQTNTAAPKPTLGTTEETNLKGGSKVFIVDSEIQASNKRNSENNAFATIF